MPWNGLVNALAIACAAAMPAWGESRRPESPSLDETEIAAQIDRTLVQETKNGSNRPRARRADDYVFARRAYFDLIGRPPRTSELREFVADKGKSKRERLVDALLTDSAYGRNWARYWRDVVFFRRSEDRALLASPAMVEFLADKLQAGAGWDEIASAFITAKGDVRRRGDTAVIMAQAGRPEETVAEVARIFLGIQIQCAQCHDHPFDQWRREEFHELAAFFPRVSLRPVRDEPRSFVVIGSDYGPKKKRPQNDRYLGQLEHRMPDLEDPQAEGELIVPRFFLNNETLPLGTSDRERRDKLASWLTGPENEWFAKAFVNRIWFELTGAGFVEPIDDLGPGRACSAPETLETLADHFVASGYDVRFLFRVIMRTQHYQRESSSREEATASDFRGTHPRKLRSDELLASLVHVLELPLDPDPQPEGAMEGGMQAFRPGPGLKFATVFGYDPSDPREEIVASVPQALMLMNSRLVALGTNARRPLGLARALRQFPDDQALVQELFLRCLARPPERSEMAVSLACLREARTRAEGAEDLLWSLVNSAEFLYRI